MLFRTIRIVRWFALGFVGAFWLVLVVVAFGFMPEFSNRWTISDGFVQAASWGRSAAVGFGKGNKSMFVSFQPQNKMTMFNACNVHVIYAWPFMVVSHGLGCGDEI